MISTFWTSGLLTKSILMSFACLTAATSGFTIIVNGRWTKWVLNKYTFISCTRIIVLCDSNKEQLPELLKQTQEGNCQLEK
ncbi:hypothetical protein BLOT_011018, partial [Blomia tropicalis]